VTKRLPLRRVRAGPDVSRRDLARGAGRRWGAWILHALAVAAGTLISLPEAEQLQLRDVFKNVLRSQDIAARAAAEEGLGWVGDPQKDAGTLEFGGLSKRVPQQGAQSIANRVAEGSWILPALQQ
jgi:hypothetical protein